MNNTIEEIRELLGKITQGNWRVSERDNFNHHSYMIRGDGEHEINTCICKTAHWLDSDSFQESEANAEFIAKAPEIINDLLNEIDKQWIPVSERLPLNEDDLPESGYASIEVLISANGYVYLDDYSIGSKPRFWSHFNHPEATHWMPLPSSPK